MFGVMVVVRSSLMVFGGVDCGLMQIVVGRLVKMIVYGDGDDIVSSSVLG